MSSRCSLKLFGGLALEGQSGALNGRVTQHRQLAVLALLASSPAGLSRDKLLGYLWPEMEGERGRHLLSDTLYVIRKELGEDALTVSSDCLCLNLDFVWTDLSAFEEALAHGELERALELYKGPFLDGFYLSGSRGFEGWVDGERAQCAKEATAAAWQLSAREEESGNVVGAAGWARRATKIDPLDEEGIQCLIRLLDEAGDRAGAVREFEGFARSLAEEYELEPSPETRELIEAIRERQESRQAPAKLAEAVASDAPDLLPPDFMAASANRLGWIGLIYAAGYSLIYFVPRLAARPPLLEFFLRPQSVVAGVSILMGFAVFVLARRAAMAARPLLTLGLVFEVVGSLGIAMSEFWGTFPGWNQDLLLTSFFIGIPWECVLIIGFPLVAPDTPRRTLIASLAAASAGPVTIIAAAAFGEPFPDAPWYFIAGYFLFTTYVCAGIAYLVSRMLGHRLSGVSEHRRVAA